MKIEVTKIENVHPYENNPRKNENAVKAVAESIKEFGFNTPIVIDANGEIIAGHTRYKAAKKLGLKTVPTIKAEDLTEEQVRAFRLADNKVSESSYDAGIIEDELANLDDIDMTRFGFIPDLLEETTGPEAEASSGILRITVTNEQKETIDRAFSRLGEIPKEILGNTNRQGNRLYTLVKKWAEIRSIT